MKDTILNTQEEWKTIPDFPNYQVSNYGRIKSPNKILKQALNYAGYCIVTLCNSERNSTPRVHRVVAEAFIPNPENKPFVNHIDGNKTNNCVDNLEWCTSKENMRHAIDTGLIKQKRLSLNEIKELKFDYKSGMTIPELSKKYGISESGVSKNLIEIHKKRIISQSLKDEIRSLYSTGLYSQKDLCYLFDISKGSVYNILKQQSH